ncbi:MAG: YraN family protein [Myxococcota bacterium]
MVQEASNPSDKVLQAERTMPSPTQAWGWRIEAEAAEFLVEQGYRIVARNFRGGGGELDLVGWDDEVLCFIEVRARRTDRFGHPALTINRRKQQRIVRSAHAYLAKFRALPMTRFDVVAVVAPDDDGRQFSLFKDAFEAGE